MSSTKYLFAVPAAQVIYQDKIEKGVLVGRDVLEVVSAYRGLIWAVESIAHGDKIHEVRDLRKKLIASHDERDFQNDAAYLLIDAEEKGFIEQAIKTFDWTFGGKVQFWVRWDDFFDAVRNITVYDESKPNAEYVEWKRNWDVKQEAIKAAKLKAEQEALEKKRQEELKAAQELQTEIDAILEAKLQELKDAGKFGHAAVIADLSPEVRAEAETEARAIIAARKEEASKPAAAEVVETKVEETKTVPSVEADEII
jgi:hypothetical protein